MKDDLLWSLGATFAFAAIVSVGGLAAMIPELHRAIVDVHDWLNNDQFASAFALSQIAPGPNIMFMTLLGWRIAGWPGLLVATLATVLPTSIIALVAGRGEAKIVHARWYAMTKRALPPLVVGLILASALITTQAAVSDWLGILITIGVAAHVALTRTNPLVPLFAAVVLGVVAARAGIF